MSLTITIPGAVNATTGATAPATLTVGVGIPGATGPAGPAGAGVPAGGTAGQFLTKIDGTNYNTDWVTLPAYAPLASPTFTGDPTAPTAALGDNDTSLATTAFVQQELASGTAIAKNLEVDVRNQSGSTIPAGAIVYISGATGNKPLITLAQANNDANSAQTFGFVKSAIANNATGHVIVRGELENIDTSALTEGVQLYLSPTVAGAWTTTKPSAPNHLVYVGIVVRSHPTQGVIEVAIQNGYELEELHNVAIASVADSDLLSYDSATTLWKNKSFSTLGLLTSATAASTYQTLAGMSSYLTTASAASTYYLQTNPAGYITSSALSTYAPLASPALTGTPTAPTALTADSSTTIATTAFVKAQGYLTSAPVTSVAGRTGAITLAVADVSGAAPLASPTFTGTVTIPAGASITGYAALAGATFTGLVGTPAATTTTAGLNVPHGAAPTTPVNGDVWTTTSGLFARINGGTQQYAPLGSTNTFTGTNTFSGATVSVGTSTAASTYNIGTGATLTATTKAINIGTNGVSGSTTNITIGNSISGATSTTTVAGTLNATGTSLDLGNSTAAATYNIANGATTTGLTKAINIGNNGAAGSTTSIVIGQASGTSSTNIYGTVTLQGSAAATTLAADTNTTGIATTAFVVGQAGSATPLINGTAAVGTSLRYARQDHVHPTDTTRAALASPTFTGTPAAPTAAVDTNTTQIATTAFVVGQGYLKSATASSTYAPLASPALTGTPTAPTATAGTNTTQIATTAFVQSALPVMATETQAIYGTSSTTTISPLLMRYILANPGYQTYNSLIGNYSSYVSGSGSVSTVFSNFAATQITAANGKAAFMPNNNASYHSIFSRGKAELNMDWSKPLWFAFRFCYSSAAQLGDTNTVNRVTFGKTSSYFGDLTDKGFGVKWTAGSSGAFTVMAYNGTALSTSASTVTISNTTYFPTTTSSADFMVYSDGAGNITLYCNNVQVATTTGGPSSGTTAGPRFVFETDNTTSTTTTVTCDYYGIRSMLAY